MYIVCDRCGREFQFETMNESWLIANDCGNIHEVQCPSCDFTIIIKTFPEVIDGEKEDRRS